VRKFADDWLTLCFSFLRGLQRFFYFKKAKGKSLEKSGFLHKMIPVDAKSRLYKSWLKKFTKCPNSQINRRIKPRLFTKSQNKNDSKNCFYFTEENTANIFRNSLFVLKILYFYTFFFQVLNNISTEKNHTVVLPIPNVLLNHFKS
jgi:hypothetical protein